MDKLGITSTCGRPIWCHQRRRYSNRTFSWFCVEFQYEPNNSCDDGEYLDLGDPFPCVMPAKAELIAWADLVIASQRGHLADRENARKRIQEINCRRRAKQLATTE